jgi:Fic family protein
MRRIYQNVEWPNFTWNNDLLLSTLSKVRNLQGRLIGKMEAIGFNLRNEAVLETLTLVVNNSMIRKL